MAWTVLQSVMGTAAGSGNCTATYTSNLSSGSKQIAIVTEDFGGPFVPSSVSDGTNSFTMVPSVNFPSSQGGLSVWVLDTPTGVVGTKPTITATLSGNFGSVIAIMEVSGLATGTTAGAIIDGTYGTNTGSATPATSGTYSDSVANELLIGAVGDPGSNGQYTLTGWTTNSMQAASNTAAQLAVAWKNSGGGSESFSWTAPSGNWGTLLFALKLSGAAAVAPAPVQRFPPGPFGPLSKTFGPNAPFASAPRAGPTALTLLNDFETGTNGNSISSGNSGPNGSFPLDAALDNTVIGSGATVAFDTTHVAHGSLAAKIATVASAQAYTGWSAALGVQSNMWFRANFYFTANPGSNFRLIEFTSSGSECGCLFLTTGGVLEMLDSSLTARATLATSIPLNQWFRVEGQITGSATSGFVSVQRFDYLDDAVAKDSASSAATINTLGPFNAVRYGVGGLGVASIGPFWVDDIGLSTTGPLGPAGSPTYEGAATLSGTGSLTTAVTLSAPATLAGTGSLTNAATQGSGGGLGGQGSLNAPDVIQSVVATLNGTGSVTTAEVLGVIATLTGTGSLANAATQGSGGGLGGQGSINAPDVIQGVIATLAGAGSLSTAEILGAVATLNGTGSLTALVTESVIATLNGTGSMNAPDVIQGVIATLGGVGTLTAQGGGNNGGTLGGAGSIGANVTLGVIATLAGAGSLTTTSAIASFATLNGTGSLTATVVQAVTAVLAAAGSLSAQGVNAGSANLAGTGQLTGLKVVLIPGGPLSGTGSVNSPFTVLMPGALLTARAGLTATAITSSPVLAGSGYPASVAAGGSPSGAGSGGFLAGVAGGGSASGITAGGGSATGLAPSA